jgi:hypothetical protein
MNHNTFDAHRAPKSRRITCALIAAAIGIGGPTIVSLTAAGPASADGCEFYRAAAEYQYSKGSIDDGDTQRGAYSMCESQHASPPAGGTGVLDPFAPGGGSGGGGNGHGGKGGKGGRGGK